MVGRRKVSGLIHLQANGRWKSEGVYILVGQHPVVNVAERLPDFRQIHVLKHCGDVPELKKVFLPGVSQREGNQR